MRRREKMTFWKTHRTRSTNTTKSKKSSVTMHTDYRHELNIAHALSWWTMLGLFNFAWRKLLMSSLHSEHVWEGDFYTYNPREEPKYFTNYQPTKKRLWKTNHKIHNWLQNSSIGKFLEGVCRNDNTWRHTGRSPTSLCGKFFVWGVVL